jgi:hypothetical protein
MKTRRTNALLAPLAPVVGGGAADGRLSGSYGGYSVEARPHAGYPIKYLSSSAQGGTGPEPAHMLSVTLAGVAGSRSWHCQSSAGGALHDLASRFTAGPVLERFEPGKFKFEGVDNLNDSFERMGEKLVKRLGMTIPANADPALQQRLIDAGLFEQLDALRFGGHPYLPKARFTPSVRELTEHGYLSSPALERAQPALEERLRAAGLPDYRSLMEAKLRAAEEEDPGRLELDVEAGKAQVLPAERFRDLLEHAMRIAEINAMVNKAATR